VKSRLGHDLAGAGTALAGAGTAFAGFAASAVAYLRIGGLPGTLYAAGITLAALIGAVAIVGRRQWRRAPDAMTTEDQPGRWRRKSRIIEELELELSETRTELDEHRRALANLGAQLARESEVALKAKLRLEMRIGELESERDLFQQTLEELNGGIGRHGSELDQLEQELEALISR
jgi:uncharacterized coiled-coil protein SlyX